jgi:hypothetical protein
MKEGMIKMEKFICYDNYTGEFIEAFSKEILLNAINDRWEIYKAQGRNPVYYQANGIYYLSTK